MQKVFKYGDLIRKPVGNLGGWMEIKVSTDGFKAFLIAMALNGDKSVTIGQIVYALTHHFHIRASLNMEHVHTCLDMALSNPNDVHRGDYAIAEGYAPVTGVERQVIFHCFDHIADQHHLSFTALHAAFGKETLEEVLYNQLHTRMVCPDEKLASLAPLEPIQQGQDVFGQILSDASDRPVALKTGANVSLVDGVFVSEIFGYVCVMNNTLSVLNPIWITPDFTLGFFIHFPQYGAQRLPEPDWIYACLNRKGVMQGVDLAVVNHLQEHVIDRSDAVGILVAKSKPVEVAEDASIEYSFDPDKQPGQLLEDGSIDFQERNTVVAVEADQLLAVVRPATAGSDGVDLRGKVFQGKDGRDVRLGVGKNVRVEEHENGARRYFSQVDGNVRVARGFISVQEVLQIFGDVDYSLGNIEAGKDVMISGSVRAGFQVKATGNIFIGGAAENGAVISAQGNVVISRGIIGENTKVVALGNLRTRFIQQSTVMARGDIEVGSYIFNATVRAGGGVKVHAFGGRRAGAIAGGRVWACRRIETRMVGSATSERTEIGIASDMEIEAQLSKLKEAVTFCQTQMLRRFRTLGIRSLEEGEVKRLLNRTSALKRQHVVGVLKHLQDLVERREEAVGQQQELQEKQETLYEEAEVVVRGALTPDVLVRFGEHTTLINDELLGAQFRLEDDEIVR